MTYMKRRCACVRVCVLQVNTAHDNDFLIDDPTFIVNIQILSNATTTETETEAETFTATVTATAATSRLGIDVTDHTEMTAEHIRACHRST